MNAKSRSVLTEQLQVTEKLVNEFTRQAVDDIRAAGLALQGDKNAADQILSGAKDAEDYHTRIERRCLDLMLLQQPLFGEDLRYVSSTFRVVSDLSRIDSMTRDIAFLVRELPEDACKLIAPQAMEMSTTVSGMVESAVVALEEASDVRAQNVIQQDRVVNALYDTCERLLVDIMKEGKKVARYLPELLMIVKYFERIGDHAKRIADWAVFRKTGKHTPSGGQVTDILLEDEKGAFGRRVESVCGKDQGDAGVESAANGQ